FSTDECAPRDVYPTRSAAAPPARCRAASTAVRVALEALPAITPPPGPPERNRSGSPSNSTLQPSTWVSSSVHAGLVDHTMPCTPRPEETRSPSTDGPDALAGKYAKKSGDCQCTSPGTTMLSRSARTASKGSGCRGGEAGSCARIDPGSTCGRT